jgi:hypothetical protein
MPSINRLLMLVPLALLVLVFLRSGVAGVAEREERTQDNPIRSFAKLRRGMSPEQVRQIAGSPKHVSRQILYHRYREQWVYETATAVRLTFDCPRGQLPELLYPPSFPSDADPKLGRQQDR